MTALGGDLVDGVRPAQGWLYCLTQVLPLHITDISSAGHSSTVAASHIHTFKHTFTLSQVKELLEGGVFLQRGMLLAVVDHLARFCRSTGVFKYNK